MTEVNKRSPYTACEEARIALQAGRIILDKIKYAKVLQDCGVDQV